MSRDCLAQRYQKEILDEIEEVDAVLGTASYDAIAETVEKRLAARRSSILRASTAWCQIRAAAF